MSPWRAPYCILYLGVRGYNSISCTQVQQYNCWVSRKVRKMYPWRTPYCILYPGLGTRSWTEMNGWSKKMNGIERSFFSVLFRAIPFIPFRRSERRNGGSVPTSGTEERSRPGTEERGSVPTSGMEKRSTVYPFWRPERTGTELNGFCKNGTDWKKKFLAKKRTEKERKRTEKKGKKRWRSPK